MIGQVQNIRVAGQAAFQAVRALADAVEELVKEIDANELNVALLDKKADRLREIEAQLVARAEELRNVETTLANAKNALAALKNALP